MSASRPFAQVDVFSVAPYRGNPVAVVLGADGLDDDTMAAFARWTNLSETTFVLTPTHPDADYRLRIFTPGGELPFAGHPTLGSAHAWLEAGGDPKRNGVMVQQCAAGLVEVKVTASGLAFAAPPTLRTGPLDAELLNHVASALGITADAVLSHQWIDNGPGWVGVELASVAEVLALEPDFSRGPDLKVGVFAAHEPGADALHEVRAFAANIGVAEDPVTGSLNASLAQWLHREARTPASYTNTQGTRLDRSGRISIDVIGDTIWVGGASTTLIRGTVEL